MTKFSLKLSQISLALALAFGTLTFTACGADESKAPKMWLTNLGVMWVISQDDDTIIKGVKVSGRNGKCEKYVVSREFSCYKDMETCVKGCKERYYQFPDIQDSCKEECKPIFDGQKLPFNSEKLVYVIERSECPPKNGVWRVELDTNFGTYEYELKDNR